MKQFGISTKDRILVTGASGFVGSNLVRRLVRDHCQVHIISRKTSNFWRIKDLMPKLTNHTVDLLEPEKLKRVLSKIKPDIIFHLANAGLYGGVADSHRALIETNLLGTVNLIEAASNLDYQCFINTGSSSEYGLKQKKMKESDICGPANVYAVSKLASTLYSNLVAKAKSKPIISFRLFSPFGPYDDPRRLITQTIIWAFQNKPLLLTNRHAVRDFIFIEDVVNAYLRVVNSAEKLKGEVFNIGSGTQRTVVEVVTKILKCTNSKSIIKWQTIPAYPWESPKWEADITKVRSLLGWQPKYSFDDGLKKTILWFKNNLSDYSH